MGITRFVFTSILTCDQARDVPHSWQKKLIEDYLEKSGAPVVALRPGAVLGAGGDFLVRGLKKGRMMSFGPATVRQTWIHPNDVPRCIALAVDDPRAVGRRIDLGTDRPASQQELAGVFSKLLGYEVHISSGSAGMLELIAKIAGLFNPFMRDVMAMVRYWETGKFVADTKVQAELLCPVPKVEDAARRLLAESGLAPKTG